MKSKSQTKNRELPVGGLVLEKGRKKTKGVYIYLSDLTHKELHALASYTAGSISDVVERLISETYLATSRCNPGEFEVAKNEVLKPHGK